MSDRSLNRPSTLPHDEAAQRPDLSDTRPAAQANRARGEIRAGFHRFGRRTEQVEVYETGGYRLRMPRSHGPHCDAVIVNTGGGMAGGDLVGFAFRCGPGGDLTLTTTAAEKIYRADGTPTRIGVTLEAGSGARLEWLPQETILFDGADLRRTLDIGLAADATLLLCEMLVFGRLAMGETMRQGALRDRWRVRRGDALIFAEEIGLAGDIAALLDRPALGGGARTSATLLLVSAEAEQRLAAVRAVLDAGEAGGVVAAASAWNGLLVIRALSASPAQLRAAIVSVLAVLRSRALPRLWT